jgi:hypothetical protein
VKTFNNEIIVRRNETFTIDKFVETRDRAPYIISSALKNPFFLITIASSLYNQKDRYICNVWMPVTIPRFKNTVPINLADIKNEDGSQKFNDFSASGSWVNGYYKGQLVTFEPGDAVFYMENDDGERTYKYFEGEDLSATWKDYSCRIIYKFTNSITKNWIEGSYLYNIDLVDGLLDYNATQGQRPIPISNISEHIPILGATKLTVLSDLRGGM